MLTRDGLGVDLRHSGLIAGNSIGTAAPGLLIGKKGFKLHQKLIFQLHAFLQARQ
jgi:hypothetical protein